MIVTVILDSRWAMRRCLGKAKSTIDAHSKRIDELYQMGLVQGLVKLPSSYNDEKLTICRAKKASSRSKITRITTTPPLESRRRDDLVWHYIDVTINQIINNFDEFNLDNDKTVSLRWRFIRWRHGSLTAFGDDCIIHYTVINVKRPIGPKKRCLSRPAGPEEQWY